MSRYRKIDPRIWNDEKFRELSDAGKLVFFMLLTHPNMTALGAMRATLSGLAEELGWTAEAFREAFAEGCRKGMAEHDAKACFVALPKFLKYNPPESPNVIKAWVSALDMLPECNLKTRAIARAKAYAEDMTEGFAKALPEAFAKAMPYQEQEQEQEQKKSSPPAPRPSVPRVPDPEPSPRQRLQAAGVEPAHIRDFLEIRKAKKAPLTDTAIDGIEREAMKAGITLAAAVKICCERSWQGFKADWLHDRTGGTAQPAQPPRTRQML